MAGHACLASRIGTILRSPGSTYAARWDQHLRCQQKNQLRSYTISRIAADSRKIDPPDVRQLAKMAHISVTDEEVHPKNARKPLSVLTFATPLLRSPAHHAGQGMGTPASKDCGLVSSSAHSLLELSCGLPAVLTSASRKIFLA